MSERRTKHVFRVNLAQIRLAVPEHKQRQKTQTDGAKNRTFRSSLRAVKNRDAQKKWSDHVALKVLLICNLHAYICMWYGTQYRTEQF